MAAVEYGHARADLANDGHFVGDDHHGDAQALVDVLEQGEDGLGGHGVEGAGGLVAQKHFRVAGQGAGDGHALLLAAGELSGIGVRLVLKADDLEKLHDSLVGLCLRNPGDLQRIAHVARHRLL